MLTNIDDDDRHDDDDGDTEHHRLYTDQWPITDMLLKFLPSFILQIEKHFSWQADIKITSSQ